jgi:prepilin-type N-terminal cleavage/methylation domain-containing protein
MKTARLYPKNAFTLIELLAVVGIIAILAALLLPSTSQAKSKSQSTACKNHLLQIGRAMSMYAADHNRYPPLLCGEIGDSFAIWADRLEPYEQINWTNEQWNCPAYISCNGIVKFKKPLFNHDTGIIDLSYSYNCFGIAGHKFYPALGFGYEDLWTINEAEIIAPSQMYVVADARAYQYGNSSGPAGEPEMDPWLHHFKDPEVSPPHSDAYNLLFADEHVEPVKRRDYLFPPRTAQHWNRDNRQHLEAWAPTNKWVVSN